MGRRTRTFRRPLTAGRATAVAAVLLASLAVAPTAPAAAAPDAPQVAFFDPARGLWTMDGIGDFYYGVPGDRPMLCDWNGNGTETVGLYRASNRGQGLALDPLIHVSGEHLVAGHAEQHQTESVVCPEAIVE